MVRLSQDKGDLQPWLCRGAQQRGCVAKCRDARRTVACVCAERERAADPVLRPTRILDVPIEGECVAHE
jgi:hypothetical protein